MKKNNGKIGIITWHYYPNYGSALQAYALHKTISKKFNRECDVINYRNYNYSPKGILKILKNNNFTYRVICKISRKERAYKFYSFINENLSQTKEYNYSHQLEKLNKEYSTFICGSDQIWAPNVLDTTYLLDFVNDYNNKVSYAPSIVIEPKETEQIEIYKNYISRFNNLSVREKKGQEILKDIINIDSEVVLDPTLLLDQQEYEEIIKEPQINEDFIVCYLLGQNEEHINYINKIKVDNNLKVVAIMNNKNDLPYGDYNIYTDGPKEFLGYIKNAKIVLTDSFHGLNFSIIYKKEFYVFERFKRDNPICQNDRITNILKKLEIENRIIHNFDYNFERKQINYDKVYELLIRERMKSIEFLKKALE